jgi:hypothetical protein
MLMPLMFLACSLSAREVAILSSAMLRPDVPSSRLLSSDTD